jgi:two-component system CheB/CheR fusion protein
MEQQMRNSIDEAERANAAKDHFLAVLSHELRTPLTPVLAAASELVSRGDLPEDVRADLAMIRRNVELEGRLMDDLLDLTRVSRGKLELNFAPIDVHDKVRRVVEMVAAEADGKQVTLDLDFDARHSHVSGDSARVQQILWNLLKNAVKFTPPGGTVSVTTANLPGGDGEPAGRLRVMVVDTGIGINAELLPKVFDAFEQGGVRVTRQFGGLGLGLAISKVLVDLHGGTISATSPGRDRGATFVVEFPTVPAAEAPAADRIGPTQNGKLRVLLVEDHVDTAKMMKRLLRSRGMSVKTADTVSAGLRTALADEFDVIVSDLGLPDGSGHDLLRQARAAGVETPAIVLSGFGSDKDREQSAAAGFVEHLTKPIDFDLLAKTIRRVWAEPVAASLP